ncbi:hypothetical protein ACPV5J_19075 [Vibrio rotiferianus]|uniref:hypothetical protein n=1 Tax=Vibrio rotiferianus TaxID=190895 RepID=UPI00406A3228
MSILQQKLDHQGSKLTLYQKAVLPPTSQTQTFSFVRIAGQLTGEQHALNVQVLHKLTPLEAANDSVY